ncbi:NAD-dependent epimerase/dehydratase family protein [Niastella caeni]|uniref:NAD-dependent epimerase/dehydratase family protein n=1 Tax=Niastella caeni TaxID=2569763 RepID=A0A4S8HX56_9BACT|nr:NAD-dependent epimerase/dehydratase family protein [Niastella caeni]THU39349.1 NAD-dependent epimerase/dehydratase family protein [Niastella caeni]
MKLTTKQAAEIFSSSFLVTGGAGFIGSHIAEFLLTAGARKVRVLDNLATGHFRNIAPTANHPRFEFMKGDIRDVDVCKAACKGMDYVFHLAALGAVSGSINDSQTVNNVNTSGFLNMLLVAQEAKVKRFVYASGCPIYGDMNQLPKTGSAPYAANKYVNELYADVFARIYGMETIGLRYFNVFGQRHDPQSEYASVIPKYVMQLIRYESPVINEADGFSYGFNYVENVVDANMLAALTTDPEAVNQVYNIAFEENTSLYQLAGYLKEYLSAFDERIARIEIVDGVNNNGSHPQHPVVFAEKAKELLGYQPRYSLQMGLLKSTSWYWAYLPQFEEEAAEREHRKLEITNSISFS